MGTLQAQHISAHQWQDRLLIVVTEDTNNNTYQDQLAELQQHTSGLADRKLIVYQVQPNQYKKGLTANPWQKGAKLFDTYQNTNATFNIILIGLDGGIKLQQSEFLSCTKLFSTIDAMPMRKNEMKRKD